MNLRRQEHQYGLVLHVQELFVIPCLWGGVILDIIPRSIGMAAFPKQPTATPAKTNIVSQ